MSCMSHIFLKQHTLKSEIYLNSDLNLIQNLSLINVNFGQYTGLHPERIPYHFTGMGVKKEKKGRNLVHMFLKRTFYETL